MQRRWRIFSREALSRRLYRFSAQAFDHFLKDLLDKIHFMIEQGGLGYGGGDNGDL